MYSEGNNGRSASIPSDEGNRLPLGNTLGHKWLITVSYTHLDVYKRQVRNCKKAINDGLDADMDEAIVIEEKLFGDCFESYDQKEGMAAFLEKRKVEKFLNK